MRGVVVETASEKETEDLGARLAADLLGGDTLLLRGSLGAGKTAFVRGLARGLGAPEDAVASPTFVMLTTYPGGRLALHHADLYRFERAVEPGDLGLSELPGPKEVLAIEWPERLASIPWPLLRDVRFEAVPGDASSGPETSRRRITIT